MRQDAQYQAMPDGQNPGAMNNGVVLRKDHRKWRDGALILLIIGIVSFVILVPFNGMKKLSSFTHGGHQPECRKAGFAGLLDIDNEKSFVVWGGADGGTAKNLGRGLVDMWAWNENKLWHKVDQGSVRPKPGRFNGCAANNGTHTMFIYGGGLGIDEITNEAWKFNSTSSSWERWMPGPNQEGSDLETHRKAPACAVLGNELFAFAGKLGKDETDTLMAFAGDGRGRLVDVVGERPTKRKGACARTWTRSDGSQVMIIHGGRKGKNYNGELWQFDPATSAFTQLRDASGGDAPVERNHHACVIVGDKFYIFGGRTGRELDDVLADLWEFDLQLNKWKHMKPHHHSGSQWPTPRFLPSLEEHPSGGGLIMFGGQGIHLKHLRHNDVQGWPEKKEHKKNIKKDRRNDLWGFSFADHEWEELNPSFCRKR